MNLGCRVQDQLNTSEPTAPYIIGRELNLRKLPGRQWESNPQPSEQLRPMTIKTSTSTETATTAYIKIMRTQQSESFTLKLKVRNINARRPAVPCRHVNAGQKLSFQNLNSAIMEQYDKNSDIVKLLL